MGAAMSDDPFHQELLTVAGIGLRSDTSDEEAFLTVEIAPMLMAGLSMESRTYGARITFSDAAEIVMKLRGDGGIVIITRDQWESIVATLGLAEVPTRVIVTVCPACGKIIADGDHDTDVTTSITRVGEQNCKDCLTPPTD
jgi:hypothetical protein